MEAKDMNNHLHVANSNNAETKMELLAKPEGDEKVDIDPAKPSLFLYKMTDIPPLPATLVFAFQLCLQVVSICVTISILISESICGTVHVTARLMSTSLFLTGLTTLVQSTVGIRLPVFQASTIYYVMPLIARAELSDWTCRNTTSATYMPSTPTWNGSMDTETGDTEEPWRSRLLQVSGVLMVVSVFHAMLGLTGLAGRLVKYIGPITIAASVTVMIIKLIDTLKKFVIIHVGIASFTIVVLTILTSYMAGVTVPLPFWTRKGGWRTTRSRFLKSYAVILSILMAWFLSHIFTLAGVFSNDPNSLDFEARTDNKEAAFELAKWFYVPYPWQFGTPTFSFSLFFGLLISMLCSVMDSLADYNVITRLCRVPKPPAHGVNRGLLIEGCCSVLSGSFGAGHATSTNIALTGSLVITGVASRRVFQWAGVLLMFLGVVGKFGALFVTIPKPIVGGVLIVILASIIGMLIAGLEEVNMKKPRNCISLGLPIMLGVLIPRLLIENQDKIDTGIPEVNQAITAILGTPLFVAGVIACFLDNTLPGRDSVEISPDVDPDTEMTENETVHHLPYIQQYLEGCRWTRYCPFLPGFQTKSKDSKH